MKLDDGGGPGLVAGLYGRFTGMAGRGLPTGLMVTGWA